MAKYQQIIRSVGADVEIPANVNPTIFMDWLRAEVDALGGHMNLGQDFAASISFRTLSAALLAANCDHIGGLHLTNVDSFWRVPAEANATRLRLFEDFWRQGGSDIALMKAACSHTKVFSYLRHSLFHNLLFSSSISSSVGPY